MYFPEVSLNSKDDRSAELERTRKFQNSIIFGFRDFVLEKVLIHLQN